MTEINLKNALKKVQCSTYIWIVVCTSTLSLCVGPGAKAWPGQAGRFPPNFKNLITFDVQYCRSLAMYKYSTVHIYIGI